MARGILRHKDGNQFQPYVWKSASSQALREYASPQAEHHAPTSDPAREQSVARHTDNKLAQAFRLGLCVWNLNHLGESPKRKRTPEAAKEDRDEPARKRVRRSSDAPAPSDQDLPDDDDEPPLEPAPPSQRESEQLARRPSAIGLRAPSLKRARPLQDEREKTEEGPAKGKDGPSLKKPRLDDGRGAGEATPPPPGAEPTRTPDAGDSKVAAVAALIARNVWLDVVALNEVNKGVERLEEVPGCTLHKGPHLISQGEQLGDGQHEYYPLLIVRSKRFAIEYKKCSVFFSTGETFDVKDGDEVRWIKPENLKKARTQGAAKLRAKYDKKLTALKAKEQLSQSEPANAGSLQEDEKWLESADKEATAKQRKTQIANARKVGESLRPENREKAISAIEKHLYRPVVIHHLSFGARQVNIGIIHTTPGGMEFERKAVFKQLEKFFDHVRNDSTAMWLVAGDFYLLDESVVSGDQVYKLARVKKLKGQMAALSIMAEAKDMTKKLEALPTTPATTAPIQRQDRGAISMPRPEIIEGRNLCVQALAIQLEALKETAKKLQQPLELWRKNNGQISLWQVERLLGQGTRGLAFRTRLEKHIAKADSGVDDPGLLAAMSGTLRHGFRNSTLKPNIDDFISKLEKNRKIVKDDDRSETATPRGEKDEYLGKESYFARNADLSAAPTQRLRNTHGFTFRNKIEATPNTGGSDSGAQEGLKIYQTIWATNIHSRATVNEKVIEYTAFRIADFVVCSPSWKSAELGLFHHEDEGLVRVEGEATGDRSLPSTTHWRAISDHFPVGGCFSARAHDLAVRQVFVDALNPNHYDEKRKALAKWYLLDAYQMLGGTEVKIWEYRKLAEEVVQRLAPNDDGAHLVTLVENEHNPETVFMALNRLLKAAGVKFQKAFPFFEELDDEPSEATMDLDDNDPQTGIRPRATPPEPAPQIAEHSD